MSDQPQSVWRREVLPETSIFGWPRRFVRWLFSGPGLRRTLILLAWTVTMVALFYGEENWRGCRAWKQYRDQMEARGQSFEFKTFIPPSIPDDQNFAATPFFKFAFTHRTNTYLFQTDPFSRASSATPAFDADNPRRTRGFVDLVAWGMAFDAARSGPLDPRLRFETDKSDPVSRAAAVASVLDGLKADEEVFTELGEASRRPHSRYAVDYTLDDPWGILLPHLERLKEACLRLQLKACAKLVAGQNESAFADVKLILAMADSLKDEPTLISFLVRRACMQIAIQPLWEGLAEHRWTDAQLQELQSRFQHFDLVTEVNRALMAERAAVVLTADLLASGKYRWGQLSGDSSAGAPDVIGRLVPRGWYCQEQLSYCRLLQTQWDGALDPGKKTISPRRVEVNKRLADDTLTKHGLFQTVFVRHEVLARMVLPALSNMAKRTARGQVAADQAGLGCALERYRLAKGQFPETLDALVPQFISQLPQDVILGAPYKYRRTPDGQFVLYSTGWNEADDGGKAVFKKGGKLDPDQGDWVWAY